MKHKLLLLAAVGVAVVSLTACGSPSSSATDRRQATTTPSPSVWTGAGSCANITVHDIASIVRQNPGNYSGVFLATAGEPGTPRWDNPTNAPPTASPGVEAPPSIFTPWPLTSVHVLRGKAPSAVAVLGGSVDGHEEVGSPEVGLAPGRRGLFIAYAESLGTDQHIRRLGFFLPVVGGRFFLSDCQSATDFSDATPTVQRLPVARGKSVTLYEVRGHLLPQEEVQRLF